MTEAIVLDHLIFEVRDPAATAAFFASTLGLAGVRLEEFARGEVPFASVRIGAQTIIDLFPPRMWRGREPANPNHVCFAVSPAALAELRARLGALGVPITRTDDHNFGARGYASSIYFEAPDAIAIEVRAYAAS